MPQIMCSGLQEAVRSIDIPPRSNPGSIFLRPKTQPPCFGRQRFTSSGNAHDEQTLGCRQAIKEFEKLSNKSWMTSWVDTIWLLVRISVVLAFHIGIQADAHSE